MLMFHVHISLLVVIINILVFEADVFAMYTSRHMENPSKIKLHIIA